MRFTDKAKVDEKDVRRRMTAVDETAILAGIRAGEPDWGSIYLTYRDTLYREVGRVLRDEERYPGGLDPDDIVLEIVQKLQEKGIPSDVRRLRSYLIAVAHNHAVDLLRHHSFHHKDEFGEVMVAREVGLEDEFASALMDSNVDVEGAVLEDILSEEIIDNLNLLTPGERHVLVERAMRRRPAREVASELGVSPQRVPQLARAAALRIARALKLLEEGRNA